MMPRIATLRARCAALVLAFPAHAGTLVCFGKLSQVQTAASGELRVLSVSPRRSPLDRASG